MELFELEIAKIGANIADTSTKATKERELTLKLSFKPDLDRKSIDVTTRAILKLAGIADHASRVYLGKDTDGHPLLFDTDPRQELLFEAPVAENTVLQFETGTK